MQFQVLALLLAISSAVQAGGWKKYSEAEYAVSGCKYGIDKVANFCGKVESTKKYKCICSNKYALTSWLNCGYEYYPNVPVKEFNEQVLDICGPIAKLTEANLTKTWEKHSGELVDIDTLHHFNKTSPKFPIRGEKVRIAVEGGYYGLRNRFQNVTTSHYLGIAFVAGVGLVIVLTGIINWLARLSRAFANSGNNELQNSVRKHLTLGIFPRHLQASRFGGGINPDKLETFWIVVMFLYCIFANFILGYGYHKGDLTFKTKEAAMSRYYGDRSCILLTYQLPLVFLLPGRNNFFQYITRWKQSRFLAFHKWMARVVTCEILIHAAAMATQTYSIHKTTRLGTPWYRYGISAAILFLLMPVLAFAGIRKRWYELFLVTHIIFAACAIWTAFLHAKSQDYHQYYWAPIGIWIFERVMRFVRIALTGGIKKAEIVYSKSGKSLIITVPNNGFLKAHPGSHAFIHFITKSQFWQSHPFTAYPSATKADHISFNCRVKNGITKKIAEKCMANGNKITMNIAVDGFYAEESHYHFFDKSVFISSGTGFSGPYFYAKSLSEKLPNHEVKFYYSARNYEEVREYINELLVFKDTNVKPVIYIADGDASSSGSGSSDDNEIKEAVKETSEDDSIAAQLECFEVIPGKIPVTEVIDNELMDTESSIAFGVCAHPQIGDTARSYIAKSLGKTSKKIEYFEEMEMW